MTDQELKQLIESNARTAQAMLDSMVEARLERQELRQGIQEFQSKLRNVYKYILYIGFGAINRLYSPTDNCKSESSTGGSITPSFS